MASQHNAPCPASLHRPQWCAVTILTASFCSLDLQKVTEPKMTFENRAARSSEADMPKSSSPLLGGKFRLDARPDRIDFRDRPYLPPLRSIPPQYPSDKHIAAYLQGYTKDGMILDQGNE